MSTIRTQVQGEKNSSSVFKFLAIAYIFTWVVWLPAILSTRGILPEIPWPPLFAIGTCGPLVAAIWCKYRQGGWAEVKNWLRQGFFRRFSLRWWLFILIVPFILPPLGLLLYRVTGGEIADLLVFQQPLIILPTILLMVTIGGGQEEFGWRGYLLHELSKRWRPWQVDLSLIPLHAFWHLPLFFIAYTMQYQYPFWLFLVFSIGFTPLINNVYRRTGGSILAAVLFHGLINSGLDLFPPVGPAVNNSPLPLLIIGLFYGLLAVVISREPGTRR
jgi:membrane protease YdiL (CAAX protease family)